MAAGFKPLIQTTVIMTIRLDCPERLANAMLTTKYLLDVLNVRQVLVVETDTSPKLLGSIVHPRLRWLYVQTDPSDVGFHRSHAINTALPWVETSTCTLWDCDTLISPAAVAQSVRAVAAGEHELLVPYTRFILLQRYSTYGQEVLDGKWPDDPTVQAESTCENAPGGIVVLSTRYFRHTRGMSELFRAYGDEDIELALRTKQLGLRANRLEGDLLHLWHPTARRLAPEAMKEEPAKQHELARMEGMSAQDMRTYLGVTEQMGEYVQKRRPSPPP